MSELLSNMSQFADNNDLSICPVVEVTTAIKETNLDENAKNANQDKGNTVVTPEVPRT